MLRDSTEDMGNTSTAHSLCSQFETSKPATKALTEKQSLATRSTAHILELAHTFRSLASVTYAPKESLLRDLQTQPSLEIHISAVQRKQSIFTSSFCVNFGSSLSFCRVPKISCQLLTHPSSRKCNEWLQSPGLSPARGIL